MIEVPSSKRYIPSFIDLDNKNNGHSLMVDLIGENKIILEVGTSTGYITKILMERGNSVTGVEIDKEAAKVASNYCESMLVGDVEEIDLNLYLEASSFDVISFGDVLEHLKSPEVLLMKIKKYLKPSGYIAVSLPNVCHGDLILNLLLGDFKYTTMGLLDETHLRFFGYKNIVSLFNKCEYTIENIQKTIVPIGGTELKIDPASIPSLILKFIKSLPNSDVYQFVFKAIPCENATSPDIPDVSLTQLFESPFEEFLKTHTDPLKQQLEELIYRIKESDNQIKDLNQHLKSTEENLSILEKEQNEIKRSISWQLTSKYQNIFVDRFLPQNTSRRAFYDMNLRGVRIFINEGLGGFWKSLKAHIKKHLPFIILKYIDYILYKFHILKSKLLTILAKKNTIIHKNTEIDIILPVYNNAQYLRECINSAINQSYQNTHVTIVDDKSTDTTVYDILAEFKNNPRVNIYYHDINMGISATTNDALVYSSGEYVAFLDCDDVLLPDSIEKVASFLINNPTVDFVYTDRININSAGNVIEHISFKNRTTDAKNELLLGMYTSHLKVIKRDCFLKVGLFSSRYDSAQDYDIALRMSEHVQFGYINEFLYKHRVHERQTTIVAQIQQESLAEQIKQEALKRRALYDGTINKLTSIVMLTLNRVEDTKRSINALYANTSLPFELIILDNGSTDPHMKEYLEELGESKSNVTIIFEEINLGCSGGRRKAISYAKGDYIVTLDNDICVTIRWLENFIMRIEANEKIAAACAKVIFPDGKIQYNGGSMEIEGCFARFSLIDSNKDQLDFSTLIERDCDWIPGGAMIIKRKYREMVTHRMEMQGSYEDNDYALQLKKIGANLVNCPLTEVIHYHLGFGINTMKDQKYLSERYNKERLMNSLIAFYKFNQLIIKDEELFKMLDLAKKTDDEIINLVKKRVDACKMKI